MKEFFENISFTRSETRVIFFLVAVIVTGICIKYYREVILSPAPKKFDYSASDSEFTEKSVLINKITGANEIKPDSLSSTETAKTNINTADKNKLTSLPGIGEVMADRIIEYRAAAFFRKAEDIMKVKGIGKKKFEMIKDLITVQ